MNDTLAVGFVERGRDSLDDWRYLLQAQASILQPIGQGAFRQVLHDNEWLAVVLAKIVDADDRWVVKSRYQLSFLVKTLLKERNLHELGGQNFDCDPALDMRVVGQVHRGHAAAP